MFITPSFKKSLIVEQFQGNYLKCRERYDQTLLNTEHFLVIYVFQVFMWKDNFEKKIRNFPLRNFRLLYCLGMR